jgi:hypothetical protein
MIYDIEGVFHVLQPSFILDNRATCISVHPYIIASLFLLHHTNVPVASRAQASMRTRPHLLHNLRFGLNITNLTTLPTRPRLFILSKLINRILNLTPQIRTHKTILMHNTPTPTTIPSQSIFIAFWSGLLNHHSNRIGKSYRIMWCIPRQEEDFSFIDVDVAEGAFRCDGLEKHAAAVLVEEFGGAVDVVVCSCVGPADDHDGHWVRVDAVVVDWGFEEVGVLF